ncbi:MAG: hypothetical protein CFE21_16905 [Bacteroidetes bacterium B1(2017)]|nr:MAG: hypothetical protein CFE21_16905 [Bacteroidetes bacterium B1(2017)]
MKKLIKKWVGAQKFMDYMRIEMESVKLLQAKGIIHQMKPSYNSVQDFSEIEFSVFSQLEDDGIIQYLIHTLKIENKFFIEFGVQNYIESNTRFLLMNDNWNGLIYDGSKDNIDFVKNDYYYWKYNLKARNLFITSENINEAFIADGVPKNPGILHIDIDGNDYWIWKSIEVINPTIVIMEYNGGFGSEKAVTVPYKPDFERYSAHFSGLFFGASLQSLCDLAEQKGYYFVGSNSYGNNAYFVKKESIANLKPISCQEGFRRSLCRQNKDANGEFTYTLDEEILNSFKDLKVYNTRTNQIENLN